MGSRAQIELSGYEVAKAALAEMQHCKCCYCEKVEEQPKYRDVEHYRPKSQYWWLTWSWDNLLFACVDCNREHKRDRFPLAPGSVALTAEQLPPGGEQPLVLDPADRASDPTEAIEFRREVVQRRERWRPYGLTERGRTTIDVCGLDRPSLLTLYTDHVVHHVRPRISDLLAAHREKRRSGRGARMAEPARSNAAVSRAVVRRAPDAGSSRRLCALPPGAAASSAMTR